MYKTLESILNLSAGHVLLPMHFIDSVILYSLTGSRTGLSLLAGGGSHASYQPVKTFLNNLATDKEQDDIQGDVVMVFDNNQILHRQWKVKCDGKFQCHIITMIVLFELDRNGQLQRSTQFHPTNCSLKTLDNDDDVRLY